MNHYLKYLILAFATLGGALIVAAIGAGDILGDSPTGAAAIVRYVAVSGSISLGLGVLGVILGTRFLTHLSLKVAIAYAVGSLGAILTVAYAPMLMFKNEAESHLLILLLVCFMVISIGLGSIIAYGVTEQVKSLRDAARLVADGQFETRVEVPSGDELSELADAFNRMSARLGDAFEREKANEQDRRDLVAAISHDLRTPLASMRAMLEAVQDGVVQDEATVSQYYCSMQSQIDRLSRLIDDLFDLSTLDSGAMQLHIAHVDINELVAETVESLRPSAERRGLVLNVSGPPAQRTAPVDADQIQRVVSNLVQNAIRHTEPGGHIAITVHDGASDPALTGHPKTLRYNGADIPSSGTRHPAPRLADEDPRCSGRPDWLTVEVSDTGEGIVEADIGRVFDRFYRGEKSRTRTNDAGAGLGLAIARAIVEAHRGHIWAENTPPKGARFLFTIPADELLPFAVQPPSANATNRLVLTK